MRDPDDRANALAVSINARATFLQMRDDAAETGALVSELLELPTVTATDLTEREVALALMLWRKTELAKQLLALVERLIM